MAKVLNCWEFKQCGREPGGFDADRLGVCPAATDTSSDGVNRGRNAGRRCWVISGTFCDGAAQGIFARKLNNCVMCDFYQIVMNEELGKGER
ncbi:MAG: hypothetical protein HN368_14900 [Spirochaetales bacterium]|jgi:hypothetical protein|nr:hypothetical protein [Spirochaetales bacterium]